ncbi:MAG: hypothetical protein V1492_04225 [Candidatus Micrarchaeota archaeon]
MERQSLEQVLERDYMHFNPERARFNEIDGVWTDFEDVVALGSKRIVYFVNRDRSGEMFDAVVPGILVRAHYRTDSNGNEYSRVALVADEVKPALERTVIWIALIKRLGGVVPPEKIKFSYWSYSDFSYSDVAQRPQQGK